MKKRVLIVDDHAILRDGLRSLFETKLGYEVVAEAEDGKNAVRLAREHSPDLVMMDLNMPGMNGIEAARAIIRDVRGVKIIALTMHHDKRYAIEMFQAGAVGYLLKDAPFEEVAEAVQAVMNNQRYLSPAIGADALKECLDRLAGTTHNDVASLTPKEREVLQLLAEGKTNKEIADYLCLSIKTVDNHRQRIMDKLNLHTVAELTKYAIREGLTSVE
ncbi:MAG TPA: response regulator transcription factor [Bacteroidota bacterium]|jgi:DNA-binding NarL/FixJ family response regulator|nr:response regulator transcription factor [Bacteroidota bacterium]